MDSSLSSHVEPNPVLWLASWAGKWQAILLSWFDHEVESFITKKLRSNGFSHQ